MLKRYVSAFRMHARSHMKNMRPLGDRVVLEPLDEQKEKTKTGIFLPDTVDKERPIKGKVLAVGPGKMLETGKRAPMNVKKGDVVLFSKYGQSEFKMDGKEYLVAKEEDILAVLE